MEASALPLYNQKKHCATDEFFKKKRSKRNTETDRQTNKSETKTHFGFRDVRVFTGETAANKQDIKNYCTCFKGNCCLKKQKQ